MPTRHEIRLPELGLSGHSATLSLWLVDRGGQVTEGDRIVEILAGNATIDLPAPASGTLIETLAGEDDPVVPGQLLGIIAEEQPEITDDNG